MIILLAPGAISLFLQLKISFVKMEAEERLENNLLQTIRIPVTEIQWTKKGEEMMVDNRKFDVKEYHQNKKEIVAAGIFDDEETRLDSEVNSLWQHQKSKHDILLLQYFHILGTACFQNSNYELISASIQKSYPSIIAPFPKSILIKIPSPPPQANSVFPVI